MAQCAHMSTVHRLPLSFLVKIFKWFLGFVPKNAVVLSGQSLRCPIRKNENAFIFPSYDVIHWKRKGNVSAAHRTPGMPSSWTLRVFLYLLRQEDRTGIRNETHQSFENLNQKWKRQWPAWTPTGSRNETLPLFENFNQKWNRQWPAWTPTGRRNETLGQEDRTGIRNETHQSFEYFDQKWQRQWPAWTPTGIRNETHQSFENFNQKCHQSFENLNQKWKRQ